MKQLFLGSFVLLFACGQPEGPQAEVSSVSFDFNGLNGDGMEFAFFVGPVIELVDTDFDGVDDKEEAQFVLSISDKADFCEVFANDITLSSFADLKQATMKVFLRADIGTSGFVIEAGAELPVAQLEMQLSSDLLIKEAGENVFAGNSVFGGTLEIDELSATDFSGSWRDSMDIDLVSGEFISAQVRANVPSAVLCEALSATFD